MFTSIFLPTALALALAAPVDPGTTPAPTDGGEAEEAATHTLTMQRAADGCLYVDGITQNGVVTLDLEDCNVGARGTDGGSFSTVTLPDGRVFYKGDFTLRAQSRIGGTVEVEVCHGEAVVSPADVEPFAAAKQAKPVVRYVDGPA